MIILVDSDARHVRWKAEDAVGHWARGRMFWWDTNYGADPYSTRLWEVANEDGFYEEPVLVAEDPDHWVDTSQFATTNNTVVLFDSQGILTWDLDAETFTWDAAPPEGYVNGANLEVGPNERDGRYHVPWDFPELAGIYPVSGLGSGRLVELPRDPDEFAGPLMTTAGYPGYILFEDPHQPDPPPDDVDLVWTGVGTGMMMQPGTGRININYDPNLDAQIEAGLGNGGLPRVAWTHDNLRFDWLPDKLPSVPGGGSVSVRLWRYQSGFSSQVVTVAEDSHEFYFSEEMEPGAYSDFYYDGWASSGYPWPTAFFFVRLTANPSTGPSYVIPVDEWNPDFKAWIEGTYTYTPEVPDLAPLVWKSAAGSELDETTPWESGAWDSSALPRHDLDVGNGFWTVQMGVREWRPETTVPAIWDLSYHFEEHPPYPRPENKLTMGVARMSMRAVTFENFTPQPGVVTLGTPSDTMGANSFVGQESEGAEQVVSLEFAEEIDDALIWTPVQSDPPSGDLVELKIREWDGTTVQRVHLAGVWDGASIVPVQHAAISEVGGATLQTEPVSGDAGPVVLDTFTRSDGAIGATETGQAWTSLDGTFVVNGGQAQVTAGSGNTLVAVDSGLSDFKLTCDMLHSGASGGSWQRIGFRIQDANNCWLLQIQSGGLNLYKRVGGGFTSVASHASAAEDATYVIAADGSAITVEQNGTEVISVTDSTFLAETKHGFGGNNDSQFRWDNFQVETLPG